MTTPESKFDASQPLANPRHEAFVQATLEGMKRSDAYRAVGYKSTNPDQVWTEAHRLSRHPQET